MSRPPAAAMENFHAPPKDTSAAALSNHVYNDLTPQSFVPSAVSAESPSVLDFSPPIYPSDAIDQLPPSTAEELRPVFDQASGVTFTSAADNQKAGVEPDFYLGEDGKLRANPNKTQPNKDGSINIELQTKNKNETNALKFADQLQKAAIKDLISYFSQNNPGAKIPQHWLDQLQKEPDLPPAPVPLAVEQPTPDVTPSQPQDGPQPRPQPSDGGGSHGGGSGGHTSGGGDGGGGGLSGGGYRGGDSPVPATRGPADGSENPKPVGIESGAWGGYENGKIPASALAEVYGFKVAPDIADNLTQLLDAAQKAGVWNPSEPYATGTYRSYEQQVQLYAEKGPDWAATPGKSMHGWGQAIDFNMNNPPLIAWLKDNAETYGFKNLPSEPWHYSTNGH